MSKFNPHCNIVNGWWKFESTPMEALVMVLTV